MLRSSIHLFLLSTLPLHAQEAGPRLLTLEQASGREEAPSFRRRAPSVSFSREGDHVAVGGGEEARWFDVETLLEVEAPQPPAMGLDQEEDESPSKEEITRLLASLEEIDGDAERIGRPKAVSSDNRVQLFLRDGLLFHVTAEEEGGTAGAIDLEGEAIELLDLSESGATAGWILKNDLYLLDIPSGTVRRVTEDGDDQRFNGKLDWVYQEELYGRGDFKGFWLAPEGDRAAFLSLDESPVHSFTVVDHVERGNFRVKGEVTNYPKAGDPNPIVTLGIARASGGETRWVDLSRYEGQEILIVRVGWYPDGRCLFMVQDRIQTWCDVNLVDPETGAVETLIREEALERTEAEGGGPRSWVPRPDMPRWLEDGTFLWTSARTGYQQVYRYSEQGKVLPLADGGPDGRSVTQGSREGSWAVRRIVEVDEEGGHLYFNASADGPANVNLYRVGLDGSDWTRLTRGPGTHSVSFSPDRAFLVDRVSALDMPEEVRLADRDGEILKVLAVAGPSEAEEEGYAVASWESHQIEARDGFLLDAAVLRPVPFDEERAYPVWLMTYSGPNAPSVRNRWNSSSWSQFLAQQGVVCLQVNVRSASGGGLFETAECYKQLGVEELMDLEDAVDWLCANPWADAERVGLTGYSYGGFMSAYALLASDRFVLGIAGGGVYDWRMYDTIYTERYMSTPQLNPDGYEVTSCIERAKDLRGFLHMHHGVMDDNVHFQNMMQMAYALQRAEKTNWSMMAYPQTRHGIRDGGQRWHARQIEWDLIREHLRPSSGAPSGDGG